MSFNESESQSLHDKIVQETDAMIKNVVYKIIHEKMYIHDSLLMIRYIHLYRYSNIPNVFKNLDSGYYSQNYRELRIILESFTQAYYIDTNWFSFDIREKLAKLKKKAPTGWMLFLNAFKLRDKYWYDKVNSKKGEKTKKPKKTDEKRYEGDPNNISKFLDFYKDYKKLSMYSHPTHDELIALKLEDRDSFKPKYKPEPFKQCINYVRRIHKKIMEIIDREVLLLPQQKTYDEIIQKRKRITISDNDLLSLAAYLKEQLFHYFKSELKIEEENTFEEIIDQAFRKKVGSKKLLFYDKKITILQEFNKARDDVLFGRKKSINRGLIAEVIKIRNKLVPEVLT